MTYALVHLAVFLEFQCLFRGAGCGIHIHQRPSVGVLPLDKDWEMVLKNEKRRIRGIFDDVPRVTGEHKHV